MSRIKLYPAFEHWQKSGNIILFSDPHWGDGDRGSMGYNISEEEQCKNILAELHSGDTLVCLGDVGDPTWMQYIINRRDHLHTVLIMGNHDKHSVVDNYFDEIYEGPLFISSKILLSHEHISLPFGLNLFGHQHEGPELYLTQDGGLSGINLAANKHQFKPFKLNDAVKTGILKNIKDIHRITIDNASERNLIKG